MRSATPAAGPTRRIEGSSTFVWFAVLIVGVMAGRTAAQIVAPNSATKPVGNYVTFIPMDYKDTVFSAIPAPDEANFGE